MALNFSFITFLFVTDKATETSKNENRSSDSATFEAVHTG